MPVGRRGLVFLLLLASTTPLLAQEFIPQSAPGRAARLPTAEEKQQAIAAFRPGQFTSSKGYHLPYQLYSPANESGKLPLVVVLHGSGAIGTDNQAQLGNLALTWAMPGVRERFPAYVVAPQVAERSASYKES